MLQVRSVPQMRSTLTAAAVMLAARCTPYLETEMLQLRQVVQPGSVCLDVGAAAGLYTLVLSRLTGPAGQVHSVEPLPFAHPGWNRLLLARQRPNVRHHAVALGAEPGRGIMSVPLRRNRPVTGRSFLAQQTTGLGSNAEFAAHQTVDVAVATIDALCARAHLTRLDFIKIDAEGAELHILNGGQLSIERFRPAMLIEIEARHTARYQYAPHDIVRWAADRGYAMYLWQRGWRQSGHVCPHSRNYLFLPVSPDRPAIPVARV